MARNIDDFLTEPEHAALDHTGIPGVGGGAGEIQAQNNGGAIQGPQPTLNFIPSGAAGVSVVEDGGNSRIDVTLSAPAETFTAGVHAVTNHTGLPGIPAAETFTAGVHAGTSHAGIPGVDLQVRVFAFNSATTFSTGALGFTPRFCQATGSYANDKGSSGYAYGTAGSQQAAAAHDDGGTLSATSRILINSGGTIYATVSAFSSSGIQLTFSGGTWRGALIVVGQ